MGDALLAQARWCAVINTRWRGGDDGGAGLRSLADPASEGFQRNLAEQMALVAELRARLATQAGVTVVDASAGGVGGCPFARSATGNLATEDLVWMLHGLGIQTGVDLPTLVDASTWMARQLGRPTLSRATAALARQSEE